MPTGTTDSEPVSESELTSAISGFAGNDEDATAIEDTARSYYMALTAQEFTLAFDLLSKRHKAEVHNAQLWGGGLRDNQYTVSAVVISGQRGSTPVVDISYDVVYGNGSKAGVYESIVVRRAVPLERSHLRLDSLKVQSSLPR